MDFNILITIIFLPLAFLPLVTVLDLSYECVTNVNDYYFYSILNKIFYVYLFK